jgi:hypothetical protein
LQEAQIVSGDILPPVARRRECAPAREVRVGSFATGSRQQQVRPCRLCPDSDQITHRTKRRDVPKAKVRAAVDAWRAPKWVLDAHPSDQCAQVRLDLWPTSPSTRFPTPITAKADPVPTQKRLGPNDQSIFRIDGNQRYSWTKNHRSWFVSRTRPCSLRLKIFNWCRSTAFSASSRNFDLNGEARAAKTKQSSAIIPTA